MNQIPNDILYWLALGEISLSHPDQYASLWRNLSSSGEVFSSGREELSRQTDLKAETIEAIVKYREFSRGETVVRKLEALGEECRIVTMRDPGYPAMLLQIYDPPPLLYMRGAMVKEDRFAVAIVGARKASRYGLEWTKTISADLARDGFSIVSGLAEGIDGAAHRAAIEAGGRTIGVLGCGIDRIYPAQNKDLFESLVQCGAILSEFPPGTPPLPYHFPRRNRLISGLSLGTLVVEATEKSGSMITASCALNQGRDLFALPGTLYSPLSRGPHLLIQRGAKLVTSGDDIKVEYEHSADQRKERAQIPLFREEEQSGFAPSLTDEEKTILSLLDHHPISFDDVVTDSALPGFRVSRSLSSLALKGWVESCGGQRYRKVSSRQLGER